MPRPPAALAVLFLMLTGEAWAQSAMTGTVKDVQSGQPVPDVVVSAVSPALEGEQVVVTDAHGRYRIPSLPPGVYTLRFERERFKPFVQPDLVLREDKTLRVNVNLLPEQEGEIVEIACGPPIVDTSSSTGWNEVSSELTVHVPVSRPSGRDGAVRTADGFLEWMPGVTDGLSIHGASRYENDYLLGGLSTRDAVSGLNGLPVSLELLAYIQVITRGLQPEHGRSTGGVLLTETRSGSNELHGSVFAHWAPGVLEGRREPTPDGGSLKHQGDFGATLGGPLLENKLWFFAGVVPSLGREEHPSRTSFTDQRGLQALGTLTYLINPDHYVSLSVLAAPGSSRGANAELDGRATRVMLHHAGAALDKKLMFNVRVGWLGQRASQSPVEGGEALGALPASPGAPSGLGGLQARSVDQLQGSLQGTWFTPNALGLHVIEAGVDAELAAYARTRTVAADAALLESRTGSGVLGAYVQDSWTLASWVTVNAGLRYDVQRLDADGEGRSRATLAQLSPRLGVAVDLLRNGRAKVFAQYGRNTGLVPLGLLDGDAEEGPAALAPDLQPLATRELSAGAETEAWNYSRVGVAYVRRTLDSGLVTLRGADGVLLANPGAGPASHLPGAERTYDAVTLNVSRDFYDNWLGHLSYTGSRLRGNQEVLGDVPSGASGPLLADRPHVLRAYGARRLSLTRSVTLTPGLAYLGGSGTRPDRAAARTPWVHSLDAHLDVSWRPGKEAAVFFNLDVFNVFNTQTVIQSSPAVPVRYQPPRQVRLGARYVF